MYYKYYNIRRYARLLFLSFFLCVTISQTKNDSPKLIYKYDVLLWTQNDKDLNFKEAIS